jgi:peptide/nickel transport system ATP-binding protein
MIIADEPTTALDVITQYKILKEVKEIQKDYKMAMIIISHDISTVAEVSDRMAVMYAGRIAETARTGDLFTDARHPYTLGLLSSIPSIKGSKEELRERLKSIEGSPPPLVNPPRGCRFHTRCPYAKEKCGKKRPKGREIAPDHIVWCFKAWTEEKGDEW